MVEVRANNHGEIALSGQHTDQIRLLGMFDDLLGNFFCAAGTGKHFLDCGFPDPVIAGEVVQS
jgi:hypothetical protein